MPKQTAIRLSRKTVSRIADEFSLPKYEVEAELKHPHNEVTFYYVTNYVFQGMMPMRYAILMEPTFLEQYASIPPGIEDHFVPVTQVKD